DALLMVRQNGKPFWIFPGGTLEFGESLTECGVREIEEETGLIVTAGPLLYVSDFRTEKRHVVDFFFIGEVVGGTLMDTPPLPENLDAIQYVDRGEWPSLLEQGLIQPEGAGQKILADWQAGFPNSPSQQNNHGIYLQYES